MGQVMRFAAFTKDPDAGNPVAVVETRAPLRFREMQRIASSVGYVTAFLLRKAERTYRARFFTPMTEVSLCGDAIVGAAVELAGRHPGLDGVLFVTSGGEVPVTIVRQDDVVSASFPVSATRTRPVPPDVLVKALACFGRDEASLDGRIPPAEACGLDLHLILPIANLTRLRGMDYSDDALRELMWNRSWSTVALVSSERPDLYRVRNILAFESTEEDPANCSAAVGLAGHLRDHGLIAPGGAIEVRQGREVGRPSTIFVEAAAGEKAVRVRGWAVPIDRAAQILQSLPDARTVGRGASAAEMSWAGS